MAPIAYLSLFLTLGSFLPDDKNEVAVGNVDTDVTSDMDVSFWLFSFQPIWAGREANLPGFDFLAQFSSAGFSFEALAHQSGLGSLPLAYPSALDDASSSSTDIAGELAYQRHVVWSTAA